MARKQRSQIKWKNIGCSIIGVGILSCGAGYGTRRPGYLIYTGPAEVRIEQPRLRSQVYDLESLIFPEPVAADQLNEMGGNNTTTNAPPNASPALSKNQLSISSRPDPNPSLQQTVEELGREFLPNGLEVLPNGFSEDLFGESVFDKKVDLQLFLPYFAGDQVQQNTSVSNEVDESDGASTESDGSPTSKDQTTPAP